MLNALKTLFEQRFWTIALVLGAVLTMAPCVTVDEHYHWSTHSPSTAPLFVVGVVLLGVSILAFGFALWTKHKTHGEIGAGLDLTRVKESDGTIWTTVSGCEIRVISGRLEEQNPGPGTAFVLPCNEYFDDECAGDTNSALGAYVNRQFDGQVDEFIALLGQECRKKLKPTEQQKTDERRDLWRWSMYTTFETAEPVCAPSCGIHDDTTRGTGPHSAYLISI